MERIINVINSVTEVVVIDLTTVFAKLCMHCYCTFLNFILYILLYVLLVVVNKLINTIIHNIISIYV